MNVSFPPVLGSTAKREPKVPAEPINSPALMELQNLYTDQFETSSQCSAISDRSEIGEDFWERRETQNEASESSERSVELNFSDTEEDSWLDLMDIQSEVSNPGVVQTHQPARQAATAPNPINGKASTECQGLPPDYFETSSQCSAKSDLTEIGEDFWERRETESEASESSERSVELNFSDTAEGHLLDFMDIQSEVWNPGVVQTHQPASQAATAPNPINGKASTESQGFPPDYFETSSQSPISDRADTSSPFVKSNFFKPISQSSESEFSDMEEDDWERRETQSEASNSGGGGGAFFQTWQPARQALQAHPPFRHRAEALLPPPLPAPPKQQEITDSNGEHALNEIKRISRHKLYQGIQATDKTDDEFESSDTETKKKARTRLSTRKSQMNKAVRLNTTVKDLNREAYLKAKTKQGINGLVRARQRREALAVRNGFTNYPEYRREKLKALAASKGFTASELNKQYKKKQAAKLGIPLAELPSQQRKARALKRASKIAAEPINNSRASTESQCLPPDYFETSSQSPISDFTDTSSPFPHGAEAFHPHPPFPHGAEAFHIHPPFPHGAEAFHPHPPFRYRPEAFHPHPPFRYRPEALQAHHSFDPRPEALQARHSFDPRPEALQARHPFDHRTEALPPRSPFPALPKQLGFQNTAEYKKQQREDDARAKQLGFQNTAEYKKQREYARAKQLDFQNAAEYKKQREDARAKQLGFQNAAERKRKQREALVKKHGCNSSRELDKYYRRKRALKKTQKAQSESQNR